MEIVHVLPVLCYILTLIHLVNSNGELYVGFLGYSNPENIKFNGECCDGNKQPGQCDDMCDLLFNVSVSGLNSSSVYLSPTDIAINNNSTEKFPTDKEHQNINNPLKFVFSSWPGIVNITIDVYDQDKNSKELVDKFVFSFETTMPSLLYHPSAKGTGKRKSLPSNIKMVFRYECHSTSQTGNYCVNENCVTYQSDKECPAIYTKPPNNQITTTGCGRVKIPGFNNLVSCTDTIISDQTTELSITTEQTSESAVIIDLTTEMMIVSDRSTEPLIIVDQTTDSLIFDKTTPTVELTTFHIVKTSTDETDKIDNLTTKTHLPSASTLPTDTTQSEHVSFLNKVTTESFTSSIQTSSRHAKPTDEIKVSTETISTENNKTPKNKSSRTLIKVPINNQISTSPETITNSTVGEVQTTIKDTNDDGPMKYWPGIVGGVLGAIVLVALVSYILYIRRKRLNKSNNDIYNVNPKRWVLEAPEENGTSGKSEIALETEQV